MTVSEMYITKHRNMKGQYHCPICGRSVNPWAELRTYHNRREWEYSGACQDCQDNFRHKQQRRYA